MLEWTGERFLPWLKDAIIAYEHLHRYAHAARLVKDKRVLDLASGEGYGSKLLASFASSVIGVDIDEEAVRHASAKYGNATLQFITGSITAVPIPEDHSFDVIVCFEAIEHIGEQEKLLGEVKRLLKRDGLFIVSTPNKGEYEEGNPFHVKELSPDEFRQLLGRHFQHITLLGQRIHAHSNIWPLKAGGGRRIDELAMERGESEFGFISNAKREPLYIIALASDSRAHLPDSGSMLVDYSDELLKEKDRAIRELSESKASHEEALKWQETQLKENDKAIASLEEAVEWHEQQAGNLKETIASLDQATAWYQSQIRDLQNTVASQQEGIEWLQKKVATIEASLTQAQKELQAARRELARTAEQLESIYASDDWKFSLRVRDFRKRTFPPGSFKDRLFQKIMGLVRSRESR
jgi:SAM-dependent methyltransferase